MKKAPSQIRAENIANFRLRRHHLVEEDDTPADPVTICRDVCGVQAQVMSAAYLQLWTRNHALTRNEIESALWTTRTLVKTSLMRQTLHLIPADEFPLYIAAVKRSRISGALRIMAKFGITPEEADALTVLIIEALSEGPLGRAAIRAAVRPKVSKRVHSWMGKVWSIMRLPVAEGLICYGSGENKEVCFIRADHWLPKTKSKPIPAVEAQAALFLRYLRAYGPATPTDFAHLAGIPMQEAKVLPSLLDLELTEVPGGNKNRFLLREDVPVLNKAVARENSVRLLPLFDSYLLAHREKDHLLSAKHYKRVYRNQGWISPVVLIDGEAAGVWSHKIKNKKLLVGIEPFGKLSGTIRARIAEEAESLGKFYEREVECHFE
jgi:hypothetical protein